MSIKTLNTLLLAGVLSLVAMSAAQASRAGGTGVEVHAAPACGDKCPVLAGDGPPTGVGSGNGRADLSTDANQMLAGGRVGGGGDIHASAATQGGAEFRVASIRGGSSGDF
jgi:hypothetical protein